MALIKSKHYEFSKLMVVVAGIIVTAVTAFVLALMWHTETTDGIEYIIPSVFTFAMFVCRQYYIKSGQENQIKLKHQWGDAYVTPSETIGHEE